MVGISKRSHGFRGREPFPKSFGKGKPALKKNRRRGKKIEIGLKKEEPPDVKPVSLGRRTLERRRKFIVERKGE